MALHKSLGELERPFSFAVVGDTHFRSPKSPSEPDGKIYPLRPLDAEEYAENVDYALVPMMEALKAESPAFIVITGDIVEAPGQASAAEGRAEMQAALDFFGSYEIPMLFARGNRDAEDAFDEVILPYLSRTLDWRLESRHYFTDVAGCRIVVLDTTDWKAGGAQREWLEGVLRQGQDTDLDRIFLFGHHPIWPVARAFFTNYDFHREMPEILSQCPVDAYFCGHMHNQNAILHRTRSLPALQLMCAQIGLPDEIPTPLDRVQSLLPSTEDLLACWPGYLENTAPGWYLVRVDRGAVRVEWHHLNRAAEAEIGWYRRGDIRRFWGVPHPPDARLIHSDLSGIRRATLRFCAWESLQPGKRVFVNGEDVGILPTGNGFSPMRMELPPRVFDRIQMENLVEIQAPGDEASTLGNLMIEALLTGGRMVRTHPTGKIFTWSDRWDAWRVGTLEKLRSGRSIVTMLSFR